MIVFYLLLICVVFLLFYVYYYQNFTYSARKLAKFPSLGGYIPIIGHLLQLSTKPDDLFIQLRKILKSFNETFSIWGGIHASLHVVNPEDAEIILADIDAINKGGIYEFLSTWLGTGLLVSNGVKWHNRRKLLTPAFHFSILQTFVPVFNKHASYLIEILKEECKKSKTNIIPLIANQTLATICETSMGVNLEENFENKNKYFSAVYSYVNQMVERIVRIWYHLDIIYNLSNLSRKQAKIATKLHQFSRDVIKMKENQFILLNKKSRESKLAMLDLLLTEKEKGNIDDEGIQEEVDTFIFEGHDTVSIAICFSLFLIAKHQDVQEKIVAELNNIFGNSKREASYSELKNMKYLDCCLKEVMRLYPSVPLIIRCLKKDTPLTHHIAPANTEVFLHIYNIHRDEKHFPDPEKFDPDRFLPENSKKRHPFAFIPFSAGPRNCIGQKYATLELKTIVSSILRNFKISEVQKLEDLKFTTDLVLRIKGPMYIKFLPRY